MDDTTSSDAAVAWAVREAMLRRAAVHLVMAREPTDRYRAPYAGPAVPAAGDDAGADRLAEAARRGARGLPPGWLTSELAEGLPARVLLDRAAGAGLLVLGASRPAGHPAGFIGPVARACLQHAPCPVVVITADGSPAAGHIRTVPAPCGPHLS